MFVAFENLLGQNNKVSINHNYNKLKCEFKGKQASKIESTSLCCRCYSVFTC